MSQDAPRRKRAGRPVLAHWLLVSPDIADRFSGWALGFAGVDLARPRTTLNLTSKLVRWVYPTADWRACM